MYYYIIILLYYYPYNNSVLLFASITNVSVVKSYVFALSLKSGAQQGCLFHSSMVRIAWKVLDNWHAKITNYRI